MKKACNLLTLAIPSVITFFLKGYNFELKIIDFSLSNLPFLSPLKMVF